MIWREIQISTITVVVLRTYVKSSLEHFLFSEINYYTKAKAHLEFPRIPGSHGAVKIKGTPDYPIIPHLEKFFFPFFKF